MVRQTGAAQTAPAEQLDLARQPPAQVDAFSHSVAWPAAVP